ncbi:MAG: hypothetical protein JJU46_10385 [Balneolaceae bacterium]|nr:hypothetical protein [Balneolaceae bacterium]MCH8549529.1 hypothetical protein [Balneolaceae bacterium]
MRLLFITTIAALLMMLTVVPANAQTERMDRDIRIAERVLEEIFKPEETGTAFWRVTGSAVRSDYMPGTGVHFRIGGSGWNIVIMSREREERTTAIDREWIEIRMTDYFLGYASQISGLEENDQIRITFSPIVNDPGRLMAAQGRSEGLRLTGWASVGDLKRHAEGSLNDNQMRDRIEFREIEPITKFRDLEIFSGVLETAVNSSGAEHLRMTRKPDAEYIPGYGVHYRLQIRPGQGPFGTMFGVLGDRMRLEAGRAAGVQIEMDGGDIRIDTDTLRVRVEELERLAEEMAAQVSDRVERSEDLQREAERVRREISAYNRDANSARDTTDLGPDKELILSTLREVMESYAQTLSSLGEDELIMITINWAGRNPTLPARTDIRTTKEDLYFGREWEIKESN